MTPLFDAHLAPAHLAPSDLKTLQTFGLRAALLTAGDPEAPADAEAWLAHFRALVNAQARRLRAAGIRPFVALGILPSRAPPRDLERVLELLPEMRGEARVVAIGRIGLGDGGPRAEQLFARQLQLARGLGLPAMVELAAEDRARQTRRALAVIRESALPPEQVLVVGSTHEELAVIVGCGHLVALPSRTALVESSVAAVERYGAAQLLLGSLHETGPSDLLGLSRTASALEAAGLSAPVVRRVVSGNALALLRVDPRTLEA